MKHRIQTAIEDLQQWYFVEEIDETKPCAQWRRILGSTRLTLGGTKDFLKEYLAPKPDLNEENEILAKELY